MTAFSTLKPLSIGQLLDRAIRLYRQHFLLFIGIITLTQIPASVFAVLITLVSSSPDVIGSGLAVGAVAVVVGLFSFLVSQIGIAALTRAVAEIYSGKRIGIVEAYRKIGSAWLTLIGASLTCGLLVIGLFVFFVIPCIGWAAAIPGFGFVLFFSMVVVPLLAPVIVLEGKGASAAISRAWSLARQRFWGLLGFMLILSIFAQLIVTGPVLLTQFFVLSLLDTMNQTVLAVLQQLVSFLLSVIYLPLQWTCITLLYFDVRVRTEGFDLVLLASETATTAVDVAAVATDIPLAQASWKPTNTELGYFSLITVGFALFIGAILGIATVLGLAVGSAFGGL